MAESASDPKLKLFQSVIGGISRSLMGSMVGNVNENTPIVVSEYSKLLRGFSKDQLTLTINWPPPHLVSTVADQVISKLRRNGYNVQLMANEEPVEEEPQEEGNAEAAAERELMAEILRELECVVNKLSVTVILLKHELVNPNLPPVGQYIDIDQNEYKETCNMKDILNLANYIHKDRMYKKWRKEDKSEQWIKSIWGKWSAFYFDGISKMLISQLGQDFSMNNENRNMTLILTKPPKTTLSVGTESGDGADSASASAAGMVKDDDEAKDDGSSSIDIMAIMAQPVADETAENIKSRKDEKAKQMNNLFSFAMNLIKGTVKLKDKDNDEDENGGKNKE